MTGRLKVEFNRGTVTPLDSNSDPQTSLCSTTLTSCATDSNLRKWFSQLYPSALHKTFVPVSHSGCLIVRWTHIARIRGHQ